LRSRARNWSFLRRSSSAVTQQTTSGLQTHGHEVDLVGARANQLVLASVKSFFGSTGVVADHVAGMAKKPALNKRYALLNNPAVRDAVFRRCNALRVFA
jgi:hypothetical protein